MTKEFLLHKDRKKKEILPTFRHIWHCPTQKPTLRKAKRAFILPTLNNDMI
jgi:hypothetical protein